MFLKVLPTAAVEFRSGTAGPLYCEVQLIALLWVASVIKLRKKDSGSPLKYSGPKLFSDLYIKTRALVQQWG